MNPLDKAVYEYHNNLDKSVIQICEDYNLSPYDLYNGLDYKDPKRKGRKHKKYSWNKDSFIIDSPEKYYWLGFIAADGYVQNSGLRIDLKEIDISHLIKFKNFTEYDGEIKYHTNNLKCKACYLDLNDVNLKNIFSEYNIVQNKSLSFVIPEEKIPQEFLIDFCRGLIDGDGCIRINNHQQISLSFCSGNKTCVEQINRILGINNKVSFSSHCYRVQVTGNKKAKQILDCLYKNSTEKTRLDRKYLIYYNKFYKEEE